MATLIDVMRMPVSTPEQRIAKALRLADQYSQIDGDHHKAWAIDQMVRALTGCPVKLGIGTDVLHQPYQYYLQSECEDYREFVRAHKDGEDGPETYGWDEGIIP